MRKVLLVLLFSAAAPAWADQGCIEVSSTTVTATVCTQFDCLQQTEGGCVTWACAKTQTSKYVDAGSSGCSRVANCGARAVFEAGEPSAPDTDSTEECDWYPCVQADPVTKACTSYLCVSKRVFETYHTTYPNARCLPAAPGQWPLEQGKKTEQLPSQPKGRAVPAKKTLKAAKPLEERPVR